MNAWQAVLVVAPIVIAGVGPFIAVKRGGDTYDFDDDDDTAPNECVDDTIQIPRVTAEVDPHMY